MGISAVNASSYTPAAPTAQRLDAQRAQELLEKNRSKEVAPKASASEVQATEQRREAAPPKEKGSRVDVRA
jgi:hypothetical protein